MLDAFVQSSEVSTDLKGRAKARTIVNLLGTTAFF